MFRILLLTKRVSLTVAGLALVAACGPIEDAVETDAPVKARTCGPQACPYPSFCGGGGAPGVCGGDDRRVSVEGGSYPKRGLLTYWDGHGWNPAGRVSDPRNAIVTGPNHLALGENICSHETTAVAPSAKALSRLVKTIHQQTGLIVDVLNTPDHLVTDGSHRGIQIVLQWRLGRNTPGHPKPETEGLNANNRGGLFAVMFPPGYNRQRAEPYPALRVFPGGGATHLSGLLSQEAAVGQQYYGQLLKDTAIKGGLGLVITFFNASGQGCHGIHDQAKDAHNDFVDLLANEYNVDPNLAVHTGGSRGGSMSMVMASHPTRTYLSPKAVFAGAAPSHMGAVALPMLNGIGPHVSVLLTDCEEPDPFVCIYRVINNTTNATDALARSTIGYVPFFDHNAELVYYASGSGDYTSGLGAAEDVVRELRKHPHLAVRHDVYIGAGHGGQGAHMGPAFRSYVVERLTRPKQDYGHKVPPMIKTGTHVWKFLFNDFSLPFPGETVADVQRVPPSLCGERPGVAHVPFRQKLDPATGAQEGQVVISGEPGRAFTVRLTDLAGTEIGSWSGVIGQPLSYSSSRCESFPRPTSVDAVACKYDNEILKATPIGGGGTFGALWRFAYDCDGDGTAEDVPDNATPYVQKPTSLLGTSLRPPAVLWINPFECFGWEVFSGGCLPSTIENPTLPYSNLGPVQELSPVHAN